MTRTVRWVPAAGLLAMLCAAPAAFAAPMPEAAPFDREAPTDPRRALDSDLPTDRPVVATVIEVDHEAGTVMLSTPHGEVALSVSRELAESLSVGDVVVVRFTADEDYPAASPREEPLPDSREKI